jgi:hypothetical protein
MLCYEYNFKLIFNGKKKDGITEAFFYIIFFKN